MSKPEDYQEEEAKPFNVADHLDEPAVIEAYIGDLLVLNDRLRSVLDQIGAMAFDVLKHSGDQPPRHPPHTVNPE